MRWLLRVVIGWSIRTRCFKGMGGVGIFCNDGPGSLIK